MPRIKKPKKVKEPIRLRMKDLSDGSKSLYLDIYRNGKRTYELEKPRDFDPFGHAGFAHLWLQYD